MWLWLPLAFVSYWDASVLLGMAWKGTFTRASGANILPEPVERRGHLMWPSSWPLSACCWILTSTGLSLPPLPLDTVSSPLLQRALPRPPPFLLLDEDLAHCCLMLFSYPLSAASMPSPNTWLHLQLKQLIPDLHPGSTWLAPTALG